jgi:hypothetical protein
MSVFGNEFMVEKVTDIGESVFDNLVIILFASKISCSSEICPQPDEPAREITTGFQAIVGSKLNLIFLIFSAISEGKSKLIKVDF